MAYSLMQPKKFKTKLDNYLSKNPMISYEENLINNFSSFNLSDLYRLFLNLENSTLNYNTYNSLKSMMKKNFSLKACSIFGTINKNSNVCVSSNHVHSLALIIKEQYLNYIADTSNTIDPKELYELSVIVNKTFPEIFLGLIQNPSGNVKQQQQFIKNKILATIDHAQLHNSPKAEEENVDIASSIYIVAKKLHPELNIYIPGRIKSLKSTVSNINKETFKSILELQPSDSSVGLSNEDIEKQFNLKKANTDFSGFTIVLANTDDTMHLDPNDPKSTEILKLRKARSENISFTHSLENFLLEKENFLFSNLELLQMKIELLTRLRESTYDECTTEYNGTSFTSLLKEAIKYYELELTNPSEKQIYDDENLYMSKINEIYQLLDELKKRVHDKYQSKLLEIAIPNILKDSIFSDTLKITSYLVKNVKKKNGFCALYYILKTADGREIELQAQSQKRFKDSKDGPSDHSSLANKEVNILQFFEPVDPNCDAEKFKYFLDTLNRTPIAVRNKLYLTPDYDLSPTDKRIKRRIIAAEENVKLKEEFEFENKLADGTIHKSHYSLNGYLPIFATYHSPKSMSISSPHTRFNTSVAEYSKKSLLSSFKNVLLKHDTTSCLAQQLIDRLEEIMSHPDKNEISLNGINKRSKTRFSPTDNSEVER